MKIKLAFTGDIMPGGILHDVLPYSYISENVLKILTDSDIRVGTLECAIGNNPDFDPEKMKRKQDVIYAPDSDIIKLKELRIDCVSLANNHAYDLGRNGLENTIRQLDSIGIKHCGAGMNIKEASKPCIFSIKGKTIGFLGFCDYREETVGYVPIADHNSAGMNSLYGNDYIHQIEKVSKMVDYLFVIIHWGVEHSFWPTEHMCDVANNCIKAGATGIIGGHQHRIQPYTIKKNHPIFYGLGNFLFPPRFLRAPRPMYYPESNEDTSSFPVTDGYPWVKEPTYKIWKKLGRIGYIGIASVENGKWRQEVTEIEMDHTNSLILRKTPFSTKEFIEKEISSMAVKNLPYSLMYRTARIIFRNLKKIVNRH